MAIIVIAHKPDMTKEQAQEIFRKGFEGKYAVEGFKGLFRDFVVVKNAFTGVAVKLEQTGSETKLVYGPLSPRFWARMLLGGVIGFLLSNRITKDVEEFMRSAPEFK